MSTYVYLVCLDHEPPLHALDESEQHRWADGVMEQIQDWVDNRDYLLGMWDQGQIDHTNYFLANSMRFLAQHRACRIAAHTEAGEWIDMGDGLPVDKQEWEGSGHEAPHLYRPRP